MLLNVFRRSGSSLSSLTKKTPVNVDTGISLRMCLLVSEGLLRQFHIVLESKGIR